jgi:hypothetical protein
MWITLKNESTKLFFEEVIENEILVKSDSF